VKQQESVLPLCGDGGTGVTAAPAKTGIISTLYGRIQLFMDVEKLMAASSVWRAGVKVLQQRGLPRCCSERATLPEW